MCIRDRVVAMLQQQPAAGKQMAWRLSDDLANVVQAIGATDQRGYRLKAESVQVLIVRGNVGRVGDDDLKTLIDALQPRALAEMHLKVQVFGVAARHSE